MKTDARKMVWTRPPQNAVVESGPCGDCHGAAHRSVAADILSLPQRQCARSADGDGGGIFLLCRPDAVLRSDAVSIRRGLSCTWTVKTGSRRLSKTRTTRSCRLGAVVTNLGYSRLEFDGCGRACLLDVVSVSAAEAMTSVRRVPLTEYSSIRCGSALCSAFRRRSDSGSTPAARRTPRSVPSFTDMELTECKWKAPRRTGSGRRRVTPPFWKSIAAKRRNISAIECARAAAHET